MSSSTLFKNALLTKSDDHQATYSVLVRDGVVEGISPSGRQDPDLRGQREIDLKSKAYVAPSMVDNHVHMSIWAKMKRRVPMGGAKGVADVLKILKAAEKERPKSEASAPLIGWALMVGTWKDEDIARMVKGTLNPEFPATTPVIIYMNDYHSAWCNEAALELMTVDHSLSDYKTGLLLEKVCFEATIRLDALEEHKAEMYIDDCVADAAKLGVTQIVDLDMHHNIANWQARVARGLTALRVSVGMYHEHIHDAVDQGWKSGHVIPGGQGLLTVGPFKLITDGSLGTRTACCHEPYPSPPAPEDDFGMMTYTNEELKTLFTYGIKHGLTLAVHAIGDKANSAVIEVLSGMDVRPLPGSTVEHAQLVRFEDLPKFKDLGLAASVQPQHLNDDRELADRFWPGRTGRAYAFKSLADAGVELKLGSDAPVAPLDPWMAIAAGVSRARPDDADDYPGWHPEQKIGIELAYAASTSNGKLRIEQGDRADLVVLAKDPLNCSLDELRNIEVLATMLGGRFTYEKEENKKAGGCIVA